MSTYSQGLADFVAQQRGAYQAPELTTRQRIDGYTEEAPDDWGYARQWQSQQSDPVVKQALETLLSQQEQMRQSENSTKLGFDANLLDNEIGNVWRERVYGKVDSNWDTATASDSIKNAIKLKAQLQGLNDPYVKQGAFTMDNKAGGADQHYGSLALQLADRGISDVSQLTWGGEKGDKLYFNGKDIGALNDARGSGWTDYDYVKGADGKPVFVPRWGDSSDNKKIATGLAIASMFVPGLNVAVGSMLGASGGMAAALGGGLINGALSSIGGGSFGKGFLTGAIAPSINVGGAMGVTDKLANGLINGAVKGGLTSAVNGGKIGQGILAGAAGGGLAAFNPAGSLGIDNKGIAGAVNGAISGGVTSAIKGRDFTTGLTSGAISGGVKGFNPAGELGVDNKDVAGLINNAITGLLQGKSGDKVLQAAVPGALKAGGSAAMGAIKSALSSGDDDPQYGNFEGFDGDYDPDALNKASTMGEDDEDIFARYLGDHDDRDVGETDGDLTAKYADDYDDRDVGEPDGYQPFDPSSVDDLINDGLAQNQKDNQAYLDEAGNPTISKGAIEELLSGGSSGGSSGSILGSIGSWISDKLGGVVTSGGKSGTGKTFTLGDLLGGIKGSDLLGAVGSGVNAALLASEAKKNRDFQKELQDRQWAREDAKDAERRKRQAPVSGPGNGLINAAIRVIPGAQG